MNRNVIIWVLVALALMAVFKGLQDMSGPQNGQRLSFSQFLDQVEAGSVEAVTLKGDVIRGTLKDQAAFETTAADYPDLIPSLREKGVNITVEAPEGGSLFWSFVISWLPFIVIAAIWIFFLRQMQSGGKGGAMGFGKSRARMLTEKTGRVLFTDVAGVDEAKGELEEMVEFLKDPGKFQKLGGKIPKGCLLVGPPGTGKTLLARAIAGEAGVPFFTISGSDFVEMFVGVGASRVRDMFEQGKKNAPCIIFIDEIDAVGRHRGLGMGGGNDEREQTLNQLLVEMDGFESNEGVILIAATNRPDVLDPALLRPGRFDRQIVVSNPDIQGREQILGVHLKKVPLAPDVDAKVIARGTPGFSGADLANLVNEAALLAARKNKKVVTMLELEEAKDKVMMGVERKSMLMSEEEKRLTAYHEGGHALVALHCPSSDPIHKATIIPRGRALGMVMRLPESDHYSITRDKLKDDMVVALGGRVAEELIFGHGKVTTGASSDIQQLTRIAKAMVTKWGMSDKVGPIYLGDEQQEMYLGGGSGDVRVLSQENAKLVDAEVKALIQEADTRARQILTEHLDDLHRLAEALLEHETLTGEEIQAVLRGEVIVPFHKQTPTSPKVRRSSIPLGGRTPAAPANDGGAADDAKAQVPEQASGAPKGTKAPKAAAKSSGGGTKAGKMTAKPKAPSGKASRSQKAPEASDGVAKAEKPAANRKPRKTGGAE